MRAYRLGKVAIAAALFVAGATVGAHAEDPVKPNAQLEVKAGVTLSPEQQQQQADATSRRAQQLAERMTRMLDEARRDKDIMRATCVNRKLTEVNANARNVEQRSKALRDALASGDTGRANHEYTVLSVLSQKLDSLNAEAAQCLGQSMYEPGASQVVTTISGTTPVIDPSVVPAPPPPPPAVSVPPPVEEPASPMS